MFRFRSYRIVFQIICLAVALGFVLAVQAGLRGRGKYCGVVVFDRWHTCFLLSGAYITYVSEGAKGELKSYQGTAVQVDASEVFQPMNPGDALTKKYKIVGPAPIVTHSPRLQGLQLTVEAAFDTNNPAFLIRVRNAGNEPIEIYSGEIGPTVLGKNHEIPFSPSDGSSVALITRVNLSLLLSRASEFRKNQSRYSIYYPEGSKETFPERFIVHPGLQKTARVECKLPKGQYQFLVGYGGGVHESKSLASNEISFDVNDHGVPTLANPDSDPK
jgi:hypothetical protein